MSPICDWPSGMGHLSSTGALPAGFGSGSTLRRPTVTMSHSPLSIFHHCPDQTRTADTSHPVSDPRRFLIRLSASRPPGRCPPLLLRRGMAARARLVHSYNTFFDFILRFPPQPRRLPSHPLPETEQFRLHNLIVALTFSRTIRFFSEPSHSQIAILASSPPFFSLSSSSI